MTPALATSRLRAWLDELPGFLDDANPDTRTFCIGSLRRICDEDLLAKKVAAELAHPWAPVGQVLIVVSENDVLGTALALLGACLTGNRVRIKARHGRAMLASLARALEHECEILDWDSARQDDAAVLADIDAVLLAGGDEVIRHYRRVAPAHVRLIEWGPKLSAAAVGRDADPRDQAALSRLIADVTLFGQRVCSSPQLVLVEPAVEEALTAALRARLPTLPVLDDDVRLAQLVRARELALRGRLDGSVRVWHDAATGWGITASRQLDPARWLHRGFQLVIGNLDAHLAELGRRYRRRLQTLGTWGTGGVRGGFTRVCAIGAMHARSPLEPHDGAFELASLVDFLSA